jgi:hypothetical protein
VPKIGQQPRGLLCRHDAFGLHFSSGRLGQQSYSQLPGIGAHFL